MGNERVNFDKPSYVPGDLVNATIIIPPKQTKIRKIIISVEIGEFTQRRSRDYDGDYVTEDDTYYHAYQDLMIGPDTKEQEVNIKIQLPPYELRPLNFNHEGHKVNIFQRIHIKYDIPFGTDDHSYFQIPVSFPVQNVMTPFKTDYEGIVFEVDTNMLVLSPQSSESAITVSLIIDNPIDIRRIKLEFIGTISIRVKNHRKEIEIKRDIYDFEDPRQFPARLVIPNIEMSTSTGELHILQYFLKLTFDIPFKSDINLVIPFTAFHSY